MKRKEKSSLIMRIHICGPSWPSPC